MEREGRRIDVRRGGPCAGGSIQASTFCAYFVWGIFPEMAVFGKAAPQIFTQPIALRAQEIEEIPF